MQAFLRLRNHWLFRQELMTRDFGTNQGLKSADILCVFQGFQAAELVQKSHQLPQVILLLVALNNGGGHKPLNSAAEELRVCPVIPSARDRIM